MIRFLTRSCASAQNIEGRNALSQGANVLILDSDVLTIIQHGKGAVFEKLVQRLDAADEDVAVTVVSLEEQTRGWLAYIAKQRSFDQQIAAYLRLHELVEDFSDRHILDFDEAAANEAMRLSRMKLRLGTMDLKIAAIALKSGSTLLSANVRDFRRVPGLQLEEWNY
jgi:tRNA(fMet)-specific endonuclease VapC